MKKYNIRPGDMILTPDEVGIILKKTQKYLYYFYKNHSCRIRKDKFWNLVDSVENGYNIIYAGGTKNRKKKKTMRMLDLHGTKHEEAEEKIKNFLNFIELPCEVITGNSKKMTQILKKVLDEYGWNSEPKDFHNLGSVIITE